MLEIRGFEDLRTLENAGLNCIRLEINLESPLFDFLGRSNHGVEVADRLDTVMRLLE